MNEERTCRSWFWCSSTSTVPVTGLSVGTAWRFFTNDCEHFYILLVHGQRKATCLAQGWAAVRDKGAAVPRPADATRQSSAGSPGESRETSAAPQRLGDGCCVGLTGSLPQDGQFIILILEFPAVGWDSMGLDGCVAGEVWPLHSATYFILLVCNWWQRYRGASRLSWLWLSTLCRSGSFNPNRSSECPVSVKINVKQTSRVLKDEDYPIYLLL